MSGPNTDTARRHLEQYHADAVDMPKPLTDEQVRLIHDEDHENDEGILHPHSHLADDTVVDR